MDTAISSMPHSPGSVVTFYSYKGGVGRSMALANIGVLLARAGKRVLLVDWDLEAPGLERYFRDHRLSTPELAGGLLSLFEAARNSPEVPWRSYTAQISGLSGTPITFLGSGYDQPGYSGRLADFTWKDFFEQPHGSQFLETLRNQWREQFDFILLDSRTGVTDSSGLCTIFMPDVLMLVFVANHANVEGSKKIADAALAAREHLPYDRTRLLVFPLPSRFEGREEKTVSEEWLKIFADTFAPFYADWLPSRFTPLQIIEKTKIPNVPFFSFGEKLPVVTHSLTDPDNPGYYFNVATSLLLSQFADAERTLDPVGAAASSLDIPDVASFFRRLREDPGYPAELIKETERQFPGETPQLAAHLNKLASLFDDVGRYSEAEPLYRRALLIRERTLGPEHLNTLNGVNNLGYLLQVKGDLVGAEPHYRRALEARERTLGLDHSDTLISVNNLASLLRAKGDLVGAEPLYRRALEAQDRTLGPEHPHTLNSVNNLGYLLHARDDLAGAKPFLRRALEAHERTLGPEHPDTFSSINNLAALLQTKGDLAEAKLLLRRSLDGMEKKLGVDHPSTKLVQSNWEFLQQQLERVGPELMLSLPQAP